MNIDLYIIAAGKGSRMGGDVPKALVPISDGEPNLTTTLKQIGHKFKNVNVVINSAIQDQWMAYIEQLDESLAENLFLIPITSGLGDGHAVLEALKNEPWGKPNTEVVICWGDVFFPRAEIVDELLSIPHGGAAGIVPVVRKPTPYVSLETDEEGAITHALFSKYKEEIGPEGNHDQSIFRFTQNELVNALMELHSAFWKGDRYITQGGELSLLYVFHHLYNSGQSVMAYETEFPTLGFNTVEEVQLIQKEINEKWKRKS